MSLEGLYHLNHLSDNPLRVAVLLFGNVLLESVSDLVSEDEILFLFHLMVPDLQDSLVVDRVDCFDLARNGDIL